MRIYALTGGLFRWNTFNYWLVLVMLLGYPMLVRQRDLSTRTLQLLIAYLAVQLLWSPDLRAGVQHLLGAVSFFGILVYFIRAARDDTFWHWLAVVNGVVAGWAGLLFFLQYEHLPYINSNAWVFVPLAALFTACLAATVNRPVRRGRIVLRLATLINCVWVILSGSRGGMLMALLCVLYLASVIPGWSRRFLSVAGALLLGCTLLFQFSDRLDFVQHRLDKTIDAHYSLASRTSGRSDLAIGGWRMFLEQPLLGVGTGGFAVSWAKLERWEGMSGYRLGKDAEAHSGWVKSLAEGGVPAIVLHAAFVVSFFLVGLRTRSRRLSWFGLLVSTELAVAFASTEFQGKGLWFLSAGAIVLLNTESARIARSGLEPSPDDNSG
jgi:hypothetical protein